MSLCRSDFALAGAMPAKVLLKLHVSMITGLAKPVETIAQ